MGQFSGFTENNSSLVANVPNLSTRFISSQIPLLFDDLFETFICTKDDDSVFNAICHDMLELNVDWYAENENDDNVKLIYQPPP